MRALLPFLAAASLLPACGPTKATEPVQMTVHVEALEGHIGRLSSEQQTHKLSFEKLTSLAELPGIEDAHLSNVLFAIEEVHEIAMFMHSCASGSSARVPDTAMMHSLADQLKQECHNHRVSMAGVADLAAATSEEQRHQSSTSALLTELRKEKDVQAAQADTFMCTEAPHNH